MDAKKFWEEYILSKWKKKKEKKQGEASDMKRELAGQMEDEEYGEALGTVAAMIEKGIEDAGAFYDAAYSYFMSGDYERAAQWVDNTLRLAPAHVRARILLARLCLLEERTTDALAIFEFVLKNYEAALSAEEREELSEVLDYYGTTKEEELCANYPAIARFLALDGAAEPQAQPLTFQPLAPQVQRVEAQSQQSAAGDEAEARRLARDILAKDVALSEKIHLLNSFAAGFFLAGSFPASKVLLKQALGLDAHDARTLSNMGYTLVALGERDTALELASMMKAPDFALLAAIRG